MRLCLLGTGSPAPLPHRQGSAALLSFDREHLLVDAGRGVTTQLVRAGVPPHALTAILLTHHHYDHIGNLGDLLLTAWHGGAAHLPIFGPPGTQEIVRALFDQVYAREIRFSLALARAAGDPLRPIHEVVRVTTVADRQVVRQPAWQAAARAVSHGHALGLTQEEWPCLGYRIAAGGRHVAFSGDTVACPALLELAQDADVLVQCCHRAAALNTTPERRLIAEQVIAGSEQAGKIGSIARVKRLVLAHFSDMSAAELAAVRDDVRRDFQGALDLGEDLLEIAL